MLFILVYKNIIRGGIMSKIVNLTAEIVRIGSGNRCKEYLPSDILVTYFQEYNIVNKGNEVASRFPDEKPESKIVLLDGFPIFETKELCVLNLPDPENGTFFIVYPNVLQAGKMLGRMDLITPSYDERGTLRDEGGKIKSVQGFIV